MTYVIGDVHGHFDTLVALINKIPKIVKLFLLVI